jgi:hypothetical protein
MSFLTSIRPEEFHRIMANAVESLYTIQDDDIPDLRRLASAISMRLTAVCVQEGAIPPMAYVEETQRIILYALINLDIFLDMQRMHDMPVRKM